jgi:hypothetical protein
MKHQSGDHGGFGRPLDDVEVAQRRRDHHKLFQYQVCTFESLWFMSNVCFLHFLWCRTLFLVVSLRGRPWCDLPSMRRRQNTFFRSDTRRISYVILAEEVYALGLTIVHLLLLVLGCFYRVFVEHDRKCHYFHHFHLHLRAFHCAVTWRIASKYWAEAIRQAGLAVSSLQHHLQPVLFVFLLSFVRSWKWLTRRPWYHHAGLFCCN